MAYAIVDDYIVFVPDTGTATIAALDGSDASFSPTNVTRVDTRIESANEISDLIDGGIAVRLVGDRPPAGTLTLIFVNDNDMAAARAVLARPTSFKLTQPTRPVVNMTFVRRGSISPGMHDEIRGMWTFEVEFQEVIA